MFPFGIFPFNVLPTANPWWPAQAAHTQDDISKMKDAMPPYFKAYMDAYAAWMAMVSKGNPFLTNLNQKKDK